MLATTVVHSSLGGGGGGVTTSFSTVQLSAAGVVSTFLAASIARTENWWEPTATPEYAFGVAQEPQPALSSLHSKLEPDSLEAKAKLAAVEVVVAAGPLVIDVWGGVVSPGGGVTVSSTVQLCDAGLASTFLAASIARTENWWEPTATPEYAFGVAQEPQPALSSLHSKLESLSLEEKVKLADVEVVVAAGPLVIEVCGAVVSAGGGVTTSFSTVQLSAAGVVSTFFAASIARTEN